MRGHCTSQGTPAMFSNFLCLTAPMPTLCSLSPSSCGTQTPEHSWAGGHGMPEGPGAPAPQGRHRARVEGLPLMPSPALLTAVRRPCWPRSWQSPRLPHRVGLQGEQGLGERGWASCHRALQSRRPSGESEGLPHR